MPGGAPLEKVSLEQSVSPEGVPFEAPPAGASPLRQQVDLRLDVIPAVRGRALQQQAPFWGVLSATARAPLISRRWSGIHRAVRLRHDKYSKPFTVGEKSGIIPSTSKQTMTLPAKLKWKAASHKEVGVQYHRQEMGGQGQG